LSCIANSKGSPWLKSVPPNHFSEEQQSALSKKVQAMAGTSKVDIDLSVDPALIGGFVVSLGSQVIDASLAGQVRRLGLALAKAS
jgi:F-type H+-transporting ATPase subunit delta